MEDPADHAMGLELQIEELTEQRQRARVQGRLYDVRRFDLEITALQVELAAAVEAAIAAEQGPAPPPVLHDAEQMRLAGS
jgi:hypothetical protein